MEFNIAQGQYCNIALEVQSFIALAWGGDLVYNVLFWTIYCFGQYTVLENILFSITVEREEQYRGIRHLLQAVDAFDAQVCCCPSADYHDGDGDDNL